MKSVPVLEKLERVEKEPRLCIWCRISSLVLDGERVEVREERGSENFEDASIMEGDDDVEMRERGNSCF